MDFDPNALPKRATIEWATYVPERRPKFKIHKGLGQAKNAFQYRKNAILYKWNENEWQEIYRIENYTKSDNCSECGISTISENIYRPGEYRNTGDRVWSKGADNPHIDFLCEDCQTRRRFGKKTAENMIAKRKAYRVI